MIDFYQLRPGMKVKIAKCPADIPYIDPENKMEKWCGKVVTVLSVFADKDSIKIEEDAGEGPEEQGWHWFWYGEAIECIVEEEPSCSDFEASSKDEIFSFIFGN